MSDSQLFIDALYDSHRHTAEAVMLAVGSDQESFDILFDLALTQKYPMNMRSANVCCHCCRNNPQLIWPHLDVLPDIIEQIKTSGVKRSFMKIYAHFLHEKHYKNIDKLAELCFAMMTDVKEALAVRSYSMETAFKICRLEPDLRFELMEVARFELESPFPAMQSKASSVLHRFSKQVF